MSELALKLIREAKEKRLTRLDLGNCGLTTLPEQVYNLTALEELILCTEGNFFDNKTNELVHLSSQNFGKRNSIKRISYKISQLKNLKAILANDQFRLNDLSPFKDLVNLEQLHVHGEKIRDLRPLKDLVNLQYIGVFESEVSDLNPLKNLINIQALNFPSNQIIDLNPLKNLINLQFLNIHSNQIIDLDGLTGLVNLQELYIFNNLISDLSQLRYLINLQKIYLRKNRIRELTVLKNFLALQEVDVSSTQVSDLDPLKDLRNLKYLDISSTEVSDLMPLKNLQNLQFLDMSSTQVSDLIPLKGIIEKGLQLKLSDQKWKKNNIYVNLDDDKWERNGIYVNGYSLINPPKEIVKQGNEAILRYWDQIKEQGGKVELYEAKLIIVGEGATGKTTLFEKLKDKNHQIGNTPETHGINIHEGLPFTHTHIGDNTFHANLWDFGGQELQYMTHQFFLTPRALYVLMMDARRESPNLAYWFKIISLLGRDREDSIEKVRLLLVFNKRGNTTGTPPLYQDQLKYYEDSLDVQYLEVDFAENDYRFDNLQNAIQQSLVTLPIVKSQLPRLWKAVREDLREEAKTENYIDTKRFSAICSKHGIMEEADQWLLSGYLHQLGSLLHFQNDKGLRRLVILSPQWAVDGVYTFLSEESIARNNGRFTETEFLALLARRDYNRDDADVILQLMTKNNFDICYEATEHNYVAAQLLPDNAPQYNWYPKEVLQFRYQYPIMPKGLMSRLIVRLSDDIERDKVSKEQIVWKKGVVLHIKLKEGQCRVRLREDDAESKAGLRQILIDVMGDRDARKYALRKVRDTVDDLHKKWFRSIKADEMVPCCCSECAISDNPELHKMEKLIKLRSKDKNLPIRCYESGEEVSTQDLLEGVYDKNEIVEKDNHGKY